MTIHTMKISGYLLTAAVILTCAIYPTSADAGIDKKFCEKIAKKVWSDNDPLFDPNMAIPDSLLQNNSAVIMCALDDIETTNERTATNFKLSGSTNRICRKYLNRMMVRIIDRSAFDDFSEFEFDAKASVSDGILLYDFKEAFGARIHYPDGTTRDVDINEAVEISDGKKGKDDVRYKIAVSGLTENCVLDVFKYKEETIEEFDLDCIDMNMCNYYPTMHRVIRGKFDPMLTVEYKTYNGAPTLNVDQKDSDCIRGSLHAQMIPAIPFKKFVNAKRQLPFIRMNFLNNSSRYIYHPATARGGGLFYNVAPGTIYRDIFSYLKDASYESPLPARAARLVKDCYLKAHPEATPRQTADALALALRYVNATADDKDWSDRNAYLNLLYMDALNRLKVYSPDSIGFAFFNPIDRVPTEGIATWEEPRFVTMVDGTYYDMSAPYHYPPGQMEARFNGQKGGAFTGNRKTLPRTTLATVVSVPQARTGSDRLAMVAKACITPEHKVRIDRSMRHTGIYKDIVGNITDRYEWADSVENFLCIPDNKRSDAKGRDKAGREKELRDFFKKECEAFVGVTPDSIVSYNVTSRSILPGRNYVSYDVTDLIPGLVEELNPETLMFSIGKLFGDNPRLPAMERDRFFDGMIDAPWYEVRQLTFQVPQGYTYDPASLESLTVNKKNAIGMFSAAPSIADNGDIDFTVQMRVNRTTIPVDYWSDFMALLDAASDFSETRIVLTRK
jgi:hypothetical protein